jgi:hypothetical protein
LSVSAAPPAQVRRELHDLADRFAGYLRDV